MAEELTGTTPKAVDIKPTHETVNNDPPKFDISDLSSMDADYAALMKKKEEDAAAAAAAVADPAPDPAPAANPDKPGQPAASDPAKPASSDPDPAKSGQVPDPVKPEPPADPYPDIELPANARGKSAESFATLKTRFAQDLSTRDAEIATLKTQVADLQKKTETPVPAMSPEVETELKELRAFRARLDVSADPEFRKKFDDRIETANQFIYAQLRATGKVGDEHIKKIQSLGGPRNVDMESILSKIGDPRVERLVQARLDEIEVASVERDQAVSAAKEDVDKYIRERQEQYMKVVEEHQNATKTELGQILPKLKWMEEPSPLPTTAKPEEKTAFEEGKKFRDGVVESMNAALNDDSPQMRAILIAGMAELLHLKRTFGATAAELKRVQGELSAATEKLNKIKQASVRKQESTVPARSVAPASKPNFAISAVESLDALRAQQLAGAANG